MMTSQNVVEVFGDNAEKSDIGRRHLGQKQIRSQIFAEMTAIDPERTLTFHNLWKKYVHLAVGRSRSKEFASLEEYIHYRMEDAGQL